MQAEQPDEQGQGEGGGDQQQGLHGTIASSDPTGSGVSRVFVVGPSFAWSYPGAWVGAVGIPQSSSTRRK